MSTRYYHHSPTPSQSHSSPPRTASPSKLREHLSIRPAPPVPADVLDEVDPDLQQISRFSPDVEAPPPPFATRSASPAVGLRSFSPLGKTVRTEKGKEREKVDVEANEFMETRRQRSGVWKDKVTRLFFNIRFPMFTAPGFG